MVTEDTYEDNEDVKFKTEALAAATSPEAKLIVQTYYSWRDKIIDTIKKIDDSKYHISLAPPHARVGSGAIQRFDLHVLTGRSKYTRDRILSEFVTGTPWLLSCELSKHDDIMIHITAFHSKIRERGSGWTYDVDVGNERELRITLNTKDITEFVNTHDMDKVCDSFIQFMLDEYKRFSAVCDCVKENYTDFFHFYANEMQKLTETKDKTVDELKEKVKIVLD